MNHPLAPAAPAPIAKAPPRPGFGAGLGAMFSGIGFIATTPAVWPLAMVPIGIGCTLAVPLSVLAIRLIPPLFVTWFGATSGILASALGVIATLAAIIDAVVVAFGVAQPLSGPALGGIVRRA